jgi:deoxyribonuclease-4
MVRAADRAAEIGASAIQVFSDNPTSWRRRPALPRELGAFRERLSMLDVVPLSIHAPYLVNLACPESEVFERSVELLAHELGVAERYGAAFLNVHIGSHRGAGVEAGIERVADGLRRVRELVARESRRAATAGGDDGGGTEPAVRAGPEDGVVLVLENSAGSGHGLGTTVEELARIDEAARAAGVDPAWMGFCLDTAHLWGAGHAIGDAAGVDTLLEAFDDRLGLGRLHMIHLNDSRAECGSRSDRHEHIGAGRIGAAGFRRLLEHPAIPHVTYILETPGMDEGYDAVNLQRVHDLVAGRPLPLLPSAAFDLRSSKGRSAPAEDDDGT